MSTDNLTDYLPPAWVVWVIGGACILVATLLLSRALLRASRTAWKAHKERRTPRAKTKPDVIEDWLTRLAAAIATGVSAQGMWQFATDKLELNSPLREILFAFIEIAIVISAVRAKRSMRENYSAGLDGIAVWVLASLTAVLSSLDAENFAEGVFRLAAPLVAAWMWERGMRLERHRVRGTKGINWRLTPERVLVRIGLAEATDRTASEVDAHRRLTRVAKAAKRARALDAAGGRKRRVRAARRRLDRALEQAVEYAGLAHDADRQRAMLDQIGSLYGSGSLLVLPDIPPWSALDHPLTRTPATLQAPGTPEAPPEGSEPADAPAEPVDLPAAALPYGPVPDELCPVAVERYTDDLDAGRAPSLRRIKDDLRIGQPRAERIQTYLTQLARTWTPGTQVQTTTTGGYAPPTAATFYEPTVNGSATSLADDIDMTTLEASQ